MSIFQMIVLQSNLDQDYVLYANQSSDGRSSASVEVMATGMYQVSVLPIIEGVGITESSVEHREIVMVLGSATTTHAGTTVIIGLQDAYPINIHEICQG